MTLFTFNTIKSTTDPQTGTAQSFISRHFMLTLHAVFKVGYEKDCI